MPRHHHRLYSKSAVSDDSEAAWVLPSIGFLMFSSAFLVSAFLILRPQEFQTETTSSRLPTHAASPPSRWHFQHPASRSRRIRQKGPSRRPRRQRCFCLGRLGFEIPSTFIHFHQVFIKCSNFHSPTHGKFRGLGSKSRLLRPCLRPSRRRRPLGVI